MLSCGRFSRSQQDILTLLTSSSKMFIFRLKPDKETDWYYSLNSPRILTCQINKHIYFLCFLNIHCHVSINMHCCWLLTTDIDSSANIKLIRRTHVHILILLSALHLMTLSSFFKCFLLLISSCLSYKYLIFTISTCVYACCNSYYSRHTLLH